MGDPTGETADGLQPLRLPEFIVEGADHQIRTERRNRSLETDLLGKAENCEENEA